MRTAVTIILACLAVIQAAAQAIGEWRAYPAFDSTTQTEAATDRIYAVGSGTLFSFMPEDNSLQVYTKVSGLNDYNITNIKFSKEQNRLVIVYNNSNIDVLAPDGRLTNIPDLKLKTMTQDKTVNSIYTSGEFAYLATNFGVCAVNILKGEIYEAYILDKITHDVELHNGIIYAATEEGIMTGNTADNLLDKANWHKLCDDEVLQLAFFGETMFCAPEGKGLYKCDTQTGALAAVQAIEGTYKYLSNEGDRLIFGQSNEVNVLNSDGTNIRKWIEYGVEDLCFDKGTNMYWAAVATQGLFAYKYDNKTSSLTMNLTNIRPDGPERNLFYDMRFEGERLTVTGGGFDGTQVYNPGTVMFYENGEWSKLADGNDVSNPTGFYYMNVVSAAQDPADSKHYYVGSAFGGLYEFYDGKFVKLYSCDNSPLESASQDNRQLTRAGALIYDSQNTLWFTNSSANEPIRFITSDGEWGSLPFNAISGYPTLDKMIIDSRGYLWGTSRMLEPGIFCIDYNKTAKNTSDDSYVFLGRYTNQDGTSYQVKTYDIKEDREGSIWIGTEQGPFVISNPQRLISSGADGFTVTQIKVPRNDGTNLADFLLDGERINVIAVDGANRKWIGTENTGLYLVSADGLEMIHHFDETNSPLMGNAIRSLAINGQTGEVFIGTAYGLLSYMSDATEPEPQFDGETVYAYPNPVEPGYESVITIDGLVEDTDVKITDTAARVIAAGKSNGGRFTWDGRDASGRLVPAGIYLVLASDSQGKTGIATKITIIR